MSPEIQALVEAYVAKQRDLYERQSKVRDLIHESILKIILEAATTSEVNEDQHAALILESINESYRIDTEIVGDALLLAQAVRTVESDEEGS